MWSNYWDQIILNGLVPITSLVYFNSRSAFGKQSFNKLASLEATLVQNYDSLTYLLAHRGEV